MALTHISKACCREQCAADADLGTLRSSACHGGLLARLWQVTFLNITGFRDFPLGDMPMLEVSAALCYPTVVLLMAMAGIVAACDHRRHESARKPGCCQGRCRCNCHGRRQTSSACGEESYGAGELMVSICRALQVLRRASENVFVPLTVGGGIRDFKDSHGRYSSLLCSFLDSMPPWIPQQRGEGMAASSLVASKDEYVGSCSLGREPTRVLHGFHGLPLAGTTPASRWRPSTSALGRTRYPSAARRCWLPRSS